MNQDFNIYIKMHFFFNNLYNNLGILSTIKIDISYVYNINNFYFDMDILLYKNILLLFAYFMLLSLLLLTIVYLSIRDKRLVNFNESQVELYDSGDNIDCSSSSDGGNYTSSDSDNDGEDEERKLSRRRRRWQNNRDYVSKYSPYKKPYTATKNNNKNYNTYIRGVRDIYCQGQEPAIPRNNLLDKKMYKDTVRELNKARLENPYLNLDLDKLCRLHAHRYHKLLYKKYDYNYLTPEQISVIAQKYNINILHKWRDFIQSMNSEELRTYLNISEKIHAKYIERVFNHTIKWDGWYLKQVAKTILKGWW
jgi:hypothetical protein